MNYSPKHTDNAMRILYGANFFFSIVLLMLGEGIWRTIGVSVGMVLLVIATYLFIRYELTTFTYILSAKQHDFDFFVDKRTGKRGSYVCYYPISSVVYLGSGKGLKKQLRKKYKNIVFYNYTHNRFGTNKSIIVFQHAKGEFDGIIFECNDAYKEYLKNAILLTEKYKNR